jgi:hypothetical protein
VGRLRSVEEGWWGVLDGDTRPYTCQKCSRESLEALLIRAFKGEREFDCASCFLLLAICLLPLGRYLIDFYSPFSFAALDLWTSGPFAWPAL